MEHQEFPSRDPLIGTKPRRIFVANNASVIFDRKDRIIKNKSIPLHGIDPSGTRRGTWKAVVLLDTYPQRSELGF